MFSFNWENKAVKQSMISYYANHRSRQRINNKPIWAGYNIWVLAEAHGYIVQIVPYEGEKKRKHIASSTKWRLGENVALRLMECLTPTVSCHIVMNNYFKSFCLLIYLLIYNIRATGVLNKNKLHKCTVFGEKQPQKNRMLPLWTAHIKQKKQCKFDSAWLERQQSGVHSFF